jgi:hypothetical protein
MIFTSTTWAAGRCSYSHRPAARVQYFQSLNALKAQFFLNDCNVDIEVKVEVDNAVLGTFWHQFVANLGIYNAKSLFERASTEYCQAVI